jgi:hypothetical protein
MNANARQLKKHVDLASVPSPLHHAVHHVHHPGRALTARRALAAGFMFVELRAVEKGKWAGKKYIPRRTAQWRR